LQASPPPSPIQDERETNERRVQIDATAVAMFNLASLIVGFVALVCVLVAFLPLLGWLNWLIIPLAIVGAGIGLLSRGTAGRNLNLLVIVIGVVRLMLGGGIF
jgi:ABC-type long-subunit fatty acid transport system fused permease/ATPase subunit